MTQLQVAAEGDTGADPATVWALVSNANRYPEWGPWNDGGYRPINETVRKGHSQEFPELELFSVNDIAEGWDGATERFFAEGAVFDQIYQPKAE